ncbi:MAG: helix-turn-helix domain-containing protein [Alphaproteobacteria bacterium]|nr:helix-turn-helix domain-containing protein [Alphaproteobacteria bacterium]
MTPFGARLRAMRAARGVKLKDMAAALDVTPAYLSALEHGQRGQPSRYFVRKVCTFFNIIWDDAEELQRLAEISHPRAVVDTSGLDPKRTELANRIARDIGKLTDEQVERMLKEFGDR